MGHVAFRISSPEFLTLQGECLAMGTAINQTQFLRSDYSGRSRLIRPPWSLPDMYEAATAAVGVATPNI